METLRRPGRLLRRMVLIPPFLIALVLLDRWHAIRYRPALRRFETAHPVPAGINRSKVPSAGGIRRSTSDGRPVLGKPGTLSITHRLTPKAGSSPAQVEAEVMALLNRAGWQRGEFEWQPPDPQAGAAVRLSTSEAEDSHPAAVWVRLESLNCRHHGASARRVR